MDYMTMNFNRNGGSGTRDYSGLSNKPQINGETLIGNKTSSDLGLMDHYDIDEAPTESSENLITSGGVWTADKGIKDRLQGSKQASSTSGTIEISDYGMTESIDMYFKPTQDLHGYDNPWAGGAGKNKLPYFTAEEKDGIRLTYDDGVVVLDGTSSANAFFTLSNLNLTSNDYVFSANNDTVNNGVHISLREIGASSDFADLPMNDTDKHNIYQNVSIGQVTLYVLSGTQLTNFRLPLQIEVGSEKTDFEPYSNICPISGQDNATFEWTDSHDIENEVTMNFGNTYYGGFCQFATGAIYSEWGYISGNSVSDLVSAGMSSDTTAAGLYLMYLPSSAVIQLNNQAATSDKLVCNELENIAANQGWSENVSGICINEQGNVIFTVKDITTQADMDTWLSNNPIQIVYKKTTPTMAVVRKGDMNLTDDYPMQFNGWLASVTYQPKNTVLLQAKEYTNQKLLSAGLPTPPTTDGTYHLECSVSGGIPTVRWVLNS